MIKFFRHIRKNQVMENKTRKYFKYAIGEIVLVVIGILIALQINNWNEHRKEGYKETAYLERLKQDITFDQEQYELNKQFYLDVFTYGNLALQYAEYGYTEHSKKWEILVAFFQSSQIWPIIPASSTFEELKSAGELSLIQNIELRNNLSYYHGGGLGRYTTTIGINPPYRKMVRGLIPSKIQNYMWENCHKTEGDIQILKSCTSNIDEKESEIIISRLSNNSKLIEELRFYMSSIKIGLETLKEQQKLCKNMLEEIDRSLKTYD